VFQAEGGELLAELVEDFEVVAGLEAGADWMVVACRGGVAGFLRAAVGHAGAVHQVGGEGLGGGRGGVGPELFEVRGRVAAEAGEDLGDAGCPGPARFSIAGNGEGAVQEHGPFTAVNEPVCGHQ
jgi:hypothetical protein